MSAPREPNRPDLLGGIIHTYQKYDPAKFPPPRSEAPDVVSPMFNHLMFYGGRRQLTPEELANAVRIDPSQIQGLGPSLDALIDMLRERKRRILETYETDHVLKKAFDRFHDDVAQVPPPDRLSKVFDRATREEQLRDLEQIWYRTEREYPDFAKDLVRLMEYLGEKYEVDELDAKYDFTGREAMTIPQALAIKEELEKIDELLKQLEEAKKNAQVGLIDMEALSEFAEPGDMDQLRSLQQQINEYLEQLAEMQGLERKAGGYELTPKAYRLFQSKLLEKIFSQLEAGRRGRHSGPIEGDGAVELPTTKPYEFGDSVSHMDIPQSMINAMLREGIEASRHQGTRRVRMRPEDIEIHGTRNTPKCATVLLIDMSGSMRHDGQYINAKRMAIALDGLIRSEYPGDFLQIIEVYTFAKPRHISEVPTLMPKPVTLHSPMMRMKADMSDPEISEIQIPPHFTNIQHGLQLARQYLSHQDTPNQQIMLITDGLPTAHFEGEMLYLLYPPDPRTEEATMRQGMLCAREGITINTFLLPNWWQTPEDVQFAHTMAEATGGRVFFTGGNDLDRFVVWDYVNHRRMIIG